MWNAWKRFELKCIECKIGINSNNGHFYWWHSNIFIWCEWRWLFETTWVMWDFSIYCWKFYASHNVVRRRYHLEWSDCFVCAFKAYILYINISSTRWFHSVECQFVERSFHSGLWISTKRENENNNGDRRFIWKDNYVFWNKLTRTVNHSVLENSRTTIYIIHPSGSVCKGMILLRYHDQLCASKDSPVCKKWLTELCFSQFWFGVRRLF